MNIFIDTKLTENQPKYQIDEGLEVWKGQRPKKSFFGEWYKLGKRGFTLIELLVVISIIGILSALLLSNTLGIRQRAADARTKSDANQLKKALRLYYNDHQSYPTADATDREIQVDDNGSTVDLAPGDTFEENGTVYMQQLPESFGYYVAGDGEAYRAVFQLNNASDEAIDQSQTRCPTHGGGHSGGYGDLDYVVCEN